MGREGIISRTKRCRLYNGVARIRKGHRCVGIRLGKALKC